MGGRCAQVCQNEPYITHKEPYITFKKRPTDTFSALSDAKSRAGLGASSRDGSGAPLRVHFLVIHGSRRFFFGENETVWGSCNVALVFFEETSDG